jgi:hypothetical protein
MSDLELTNGYRQILGALVVLQELQARGLLEDVNHRVIDPEAARIGREAASRMTGEVLGEWLQAVSEGECPVAETVALAKREGLIECNG